MLEQVLRHLNNWFLVEIHEGTFTVENGSIALPFLLTHQYFRIVGSVLNDGLHQYPAVDLTDETFTGSVWALAVPKAVIDLSVEIEAWQEKNGEAVASPYQSESFGGYSYTKRSAGSDSGTLNGWQDAFKGRLNDWRKLKGVEP
uniref:Uncharacterized protein n=1 Tax=Podoviridae sp. ctyDR6 TaxID=2825288 RepID=A0A8S5QKY3_9CAUD|nr:MAG TPA: hypothetical protein [Podoviridae sp. ctyDR6]